MGETPDFLWIGNHPATDLCNTEPVVDGQPVELLPDLDAVVAWARLAGIATAIGADAIPVRDRASTLDVVRRLRRAVRAVLEAPATDPDPLRALNDVLHAHRGSLHVDVSRDEPVSLAATGPGLQLRLDVAAAVLDIFRHDRQLVRRCANPACVLLFLDVSKSGGRRWCDMATCGNRAKAAAHYARTRRR